MFKKIIISIIAIVTIVSFGYFLYQPSPTAQVQKPILDPQNTTYIIEGQAITLINGRAEQVLTPVSATKIITQYFGNEVKADFNNDGIQDEAFLLTQDRGGSGTFFYVIALLSSGNSYQGTNAVLLGDRIAPQASGFQNGQIIVNYAQRKLGESMTAQPSVGASKYF